MGHLLEETAMTELTCSFSRPAANILEDTFMRTFTQGIALVAILLFMLWEIMPAELCAQSMMLTTQDLTNQAEVVAVGKVAAMKSEWNANKTRIYTRVTIAVNEYLKGGSVGQELTILTPGGEIGEVGEIYSGAAQFKQEEEVVVFVKRRTDREHILAAGAQGKITVTQDKLTGAKIVASGVKLDAFVSQVKTAIQAVKPEEK